MKTSLCLAALLGILLSTAPAQDSPPWRKLLHAEDAEALDEADSRIASVLEALPSDAHGLDEVPGLEALLKKERLPVGSDELVGNWRVRSIQVNDLGVFSYPYFASRIQKVGGLLHFEKTTGSQRKSALLFPEGGHAILVGGKTVNDDPQVPYSSLGGKRESDTFGKLFKIGPGELLILLDTAETNFEIYQLKRS